MLDILPNSFLVHWVIDRAIQKALCVWVHSLIDHKMFQTVCVSYLRRNVLVHSVTDQKIKHTLCISYHNELVQGLVSNCSVIKTDTLY